jgi:PhnB protein
VTSISPWLTVGDGMRALAFYRDAFGAVEVERTDDPDGDVIVANLAIDGADFWLIHEPATPVPLPEQAVRMVLAVDDPDAVHARALAAGATEITPMYEGHGWRLGRIADPAGHHWEIGRRL